MSQEMEWLFYVVWWACRGDELAKNELWEIMAVKRRHQLRSALRKKGVAYQDLDDAHHDVIVRVLERIPQLLGCRAFLGWLKRIVSEIGGQHRISYIERNLLEHGEQLAPTIPCSTGRKWISANGQLGAVKLFPPLTIQLQVNERRPVIAVLDDSVPINGSANLHLNYTRTIDIDRAFNAFTRKQQLWAVAFLLRIYYGYSADETAEILGRSKKSVHRLVRKARARLRTLLSNYQPYRRIKHAQTSIPIPEVPGLSYWRDFISEKEADELTDFLYQQIHWIPFGTKKRRLPFGYNYGVRDHSITADAPPVPPILHTLAARLTEGGMMRGLADQVMVQEYPAGVGIGQHIDAEGFGPDVVSLSLLAPCVMSFRHSAQPKKQVDRVLEPRSALAMTGAARSEWSHEIAGRTVPDRRMSITFRTVLVDTIRTIAWH